MKISSIKNTLFFKFQAVAPWLTVSVSEYVHCNQASVLKLVYGWVIAFTTITPLLWKTVWSA